jgi:lysophospholipase L1-like esterase
MSAAEISKTLRSKVLFFLTSAFTLSLLIAHQSAHLVSRQNNTILNNDVWESEKLNLSSGVVGAVAFISTRTSLAQDRLQLGSWHGYNFVSTKNSFIPARVTFISSVDSKGNLSFVFQKTKSGFRALRLSAAELIPSEYVEVNELGLITNRFPIDFKLTSATPNKIEILFENNGIKLNINGKFITEIQTAPVEIGKLGFRSEAGNTWVDKFKVVDQSGQVMTDDFSSKDLHLFLAAVFCAVIGCFLLWDAKYWDRVNMLFAPRVAAIIFFILIAGTNQADRFIFSSFYRNEPNLVEMLSQVSKVRGIKNTITGEEEIKLKISLEKESDINTKKYIALLGSSQTWGAGALTEEFRLDQILEKELNRIKKTTNFRVLNLAVSGNRANQMVDAFYWLKKINPRVVVINLGNNDTDPDFIRQNLLRLVSLSRQKNFKLVFIAEANYFLDPIPHLVLTHRAIKDIAIENDIKLIDAHKFLEKNFRNGYLWWDSVHLTSAGQKILADAIVSEIY